MFKSYIEIACIHHIYCTYFQFARLTSSDCTGASGAAPPTLSCCKCLRLHPPPGSQSIWRRDQQNKVGSSNCKFCLSSHTMYIVTLTISCTCTLYRHANFVEHCGLILYCEKSFSFVRISQLIAQLVQRPLSHDPFFSRPMDRCWSLNLSVS